MADVAYVVERLREPPFSLTSIDVLSYSAAPPAQLLQLLGSVVGRISAKHAAKSADEPLAALEERVAAFLRAVKYRGDPLCAFLPFFCGHG
jgi:hypothetical protein